MPWERKKAGATWKQLVPSAEMCCCSIWLFCCVFINCFFYGILVKYEPVDHWENLLFCCLPCQEWKLTAHLHHSRPGIHVTFHAAATKATQWSCGVQVKSLGEVNDTRWHVARVHGTMWQFVLALEIAQQGATAIWLMCVWTNIQFPMENEGSSAVNAFHACVQVSENGI